MMNPKLLTIAIDPGKHGCGVAQFIGSQLVKACYIDDGDGEGWFPDFGPDVVNAVRFVLEKPQVYRTRKMKGDPNDLKDIAVAGGVLLGELKVQAAQTVGSDAIIVDKITPSIWKKQLKKEIVHERVRKKLIDSEMKGILAIEKSLMHNVWDAAGIGLWSVGRYKP